MTRKRALALARQGWARYPIPPDEKGRFTEDLRLITHLVGSSLYEWRREPECDYEHGMFWIRRVDD